jgi:DNA-directed RNA polymerase specialized sigma24 family protein
LQAWLKTVALNRLLLLRREEERRGEVHLEDENGAFVAETPPSPLPRERTEAPLLALMCAAIEAAFQSCPAEDFVLLQLAHADRLRGEELGRMFACSASKISRQLDCASKGIAAATLEHIRRTDPWIELTWDDFIELSRVASPAILGAE